MSPSRKQNVMTNPFSSGEPTGVNPWETSATPAEVEETRPLWKKVLAWLSVAWGVLCLLTALFEGPFLGMFLFGLIFIALGALYLFAPKRNRRWKFVVPAALVAIVVSALLMPATPEVDPGPASAITTVTRTSASPSKSTTSTTTPPSSTASTTTTATETEAGENNEPTPPVGDEPESSPSPAQQHGFLETSREPAPAPEPEPAPAPAPEPELAPAPAPAPAPNPSTGGGLTCAEIGHKTYPGDGFYVPDHDSDGNGVGCQSYPNP